MFNRARTQFKYTLESSMLLGYWSIILNHGLVSSIPDQSL